MRNRMKKAWKSLNIQRFMAHEKTPTNKKPMKMPWNKMKPTMFFSWLFYDNEKAMNWKALFHGVRIYGVFMGVFKFMPHKKNHEFSVNGWILMVHEKWNGFWWYSHYPWIIPLAYFSWERQRHGHHENLVLNYSWLLNQIHHWGFVGWLIWSYIHVATTLTLNKS